MPSRPEPVPATRHVESLLAEALAAHPRRNALAFGGTTLTFSELMSASDRLAGELGVQPGERVVVVAPNDPALVVGMFAAWRAGAVAVPLSARVRGFELERVFSDAQPAAAVSVQAHGGFAIAEAVESAAQRTRALRAVVVLDQLGEITSVRRQGNGHSPALQDTVAAILYTSGTTGEPRGALAGHALLEAGARNLNDLLGADAEAQFGLAVPASHAFGLACMLSGIRAGATAILVDVTSSLEPLTAALEAHRGTVLHGSPALFRRVAQLRARPRLRTGLTAGALCPPEVLEELDGHGCSILNLYGTTEIGAACSCRSTDPPPTRYRTVGRALDGYEIRVASVPTEETRARPEAGIGEIQVRSGYLSSGYHRRPWSSDELIDGGWLATGDLGQVDAAGNLSITGRAKELVLVGGFSVFPAEVESFLLTHPAIEQAAVVGRPHPALGEALHAFVVAGDGVVLEPREVVRFARERIAGYKVPYLVTIVAELPLLPSGKPDRRALNDLEVSATAGHGKAVRG